MRSFPVIVIVAVLLALALLGAHPYFTSQGTGAVQAAGAPSRSS
jgi:hypothetical protein